MKRRNMLGSSSREQPSSEAMGEVAKGETATALCDTAADVALRTTVAERSRASTSVRQTKPRDSHAHGKPVGRKRQGRVTAVRQLANLRLALDLDEIREWRESRNSR